MNLKRVWHHILMNQSQLRKCFPDTVLRAIHEATARCEKMHSGEIRFVVEAELEWGPLLADQSPRQRAIDVFSQLRVWDTEENNGVMIYVLLADRRVEIVADRGIHRQVGDAGWGTICEAIQAEFKAGRFDAGAIKGLEAISAHLAQHFPPRDDDQNELSDQPVVM
jgi:hypothetical protein